MLWDHLYCHVDLFTCHKHWKEIFISIDLFKKSPISFLEMHTNEDVYFRYTDCEHCTEIKHLPTSGKEGQTFQDLKSLRLGICMSDVVFRKKGINWLFPTFLTGLARPLGRHKMPNTVWGATGQLIYSGSNFLRSTLPFVRYFELFPFVDQPPPPLILY